MPRKSTPSGQKRKATKRPHSDFPLTRHPRGYWCKKVKASLIYFGKIADDPEGTAALRRMREDFWEFQATHKIWLAANHKPTVRGTDHGIWRRIKLIPFSVVIPDDQQDKQLPEKLLTELPGPGILNWTFGRFRRFRILAISTTNEGDTDGEEPKATTTATQLHGRGHTTSDGGDLRHWQDFPGGCGSRQRGSRRLV